MSPPTPVLSRPPPPKQEETMRRRRTTTHVRLTSSPRCALAAAASSLAILSSLRAGGPSFALAFAATSMETTAFRSDSVAFFSECASGRGLARRKRRSATVFDPSFYAEGGRRGRRVFSMAGGDDFLVVNGDIDVDVVTDGATVLGSFALDGDGGSDDDDSFTKRVRNDESYAAAAASLSAVAKHAGIEPSSDGEASVNGASECVDEARSLLELERKSGDLLVMANGEGHVSGGNGDGDIDDDSGMPFAPMLTYQKYITMQEKRVKVAIRYSASSGLRPFYLTVANRITSAHPDVLLEKRIIPASSETGDVFEVFVDGKIVLEKRNSKLLRVSSSRSSSDGGNGGDDSKRNGGNEDSDGKNVGEPDIAGGRCVFVSMEKLDHELSKARKKRRPSTMYEQVDGEETVAVGKNVVPVLTEATVAKTEPAGMTEAVLRLEKMKVKAMISRKGAE